MFTMVIDTDKYSGNFERQMCGYITGQLGECGVGREECELAFVELSDDAVAWFAMNAIHLPGEHNYSRPCKIHKTPGWFNDGMGNYWRDGADLAEVKDRYIMTVTNYYTPLIEQAERRIAGGDTRWENDLVAAKARIKDAKDKDVREHNAYLSVAVFFSIEPTAEIIEVIKDRAEKFVQNKNINIEGFRILYAVTSEAAL